MSAKLNSQVVPLSEVPAEQNTTAEPWRPVILVVDDEMVIADTLSMILSKSGFATLTAYDGAEALELARDIPPDLLISDVVMPGMTGIQLAIAVVAMVPGCKVLLFSGQAATVDLLEEARAEGNEFNALTKPVHPTDMLKRIAETLNLRNAAAEQVSPAYAVTHF